MYSVRTKTYQIVALNTDAVTAAVSLLEHAKANGLGIDSYIVIANGRRLANLAEQIGVHGLSIVPRSKLGDLGCGMCLTTRL